MRSLGSLRPLAALPLLAGCLFSALAQPAAGPDPLGTQPARWSPLSTTAQMFGTITTAPGALTVLNHRIPLTAPEPLSPPDIRNAATLLSTHTVPATTAALYKVDIPPTFKLRDNNTLCGKQAVTWLLLLRNPAGPDKGLEMATFSSKARPDLTPAVIDNSTDLCGTFGFLPTNK